MESATRPSEPHHQYHSWKLVEDHPPPEVDRSVDPPCIPAYLTQNHEGWWHCRLCSQRATPEHIQGIKHTKRKANREYEESNSRSFSAFGVRPTENLSATLALQGPPPEPHVGQDAAGVLPQLAEPAQQTHPDRHSQLQLDRLHQEVAQLQRLMQYLHLEQERTQEHLGGVEDQARQLQQQLTDGSLDLRHQ